MVEFESLVCNCGTKINSEVKLMPNERSRLILKGSLVKPSGISPSGINEPMRTKTMFLLK